MMLVNEKGTRGALELPSTARIRRIRYTTTLSSDSRCVCAFPAIIGRWAIEVDGGTASAPWTKDEGCYVEWLSIPSEVTDDEVATEAAKQWVDSELPVGAPAPVLMMLQRVTVYFSNRRLAVVGASERIEAVGKALLEAIYYLGELQTLEELLAASWVGWGGALPRDVVGTSVTPEQRKRISDIHAEILDAEVRAARISSVIHTPYVHPPTLESQVQERFRDRLQLSHRHEVLCEQIEMLRDHYEAAVQRINEHLHARSGHQLEWVIIVLLGIQILMSIYDLLGSLGTP